MHDEPDDTTSGTDERRYLVDRREYLKATGASAAAFAGGLATTGTAAAEPTNTGSVSGSGYSTTDRGDYVEVTVGAGGQWTCSLGSGDTLSNYLIDISASNANAFINPIGSGWTIENVGFRGQSDDVGNAPKKHITPRVDSGGTGTIRHLYMGDGAVSDSSKGAIWVQPEHAGELVIQEMYLAGWADNGLYGSGPGNPPGHVRPGNGGVVKVIDSYSGHNAISNFRLGTTGSYLENCVSEGGDHRSYWGYYEDTELRDCDITGAAIWAGANAYDKAHNATVTANNCRYDVNVVEQTSTSEFYGSSQGTPDTSLPEGVPTSAEEAAKGDGTSGGTSEVAEDFSHDDVPGTYSLDTGAFTTSSTRSTSDSYSIRPDDSTDGDVLVLRDDMVATAGNTYEFDVYHQSSSDADMGFLFGAQNATGWSDYTGYFGFFHSNADEIRLDYWEDGIQSNSSATAMSWPLDEWVTVELDYRDDDSSTIAMTVFDASGQKLGSVSLADATYDSGTIGWYNYHAASDWFADSWFPADGGPVEVVEDFGHDDVPGTYDLDTGAFTTSSIRSTTDSYSIRPDDSADDDNLILRDDVVATAGNTYELDVYHQSNTDADMGFLFGAQNATGWSDYTGYFGFFHSNADEIRLDYWEDGIQSASATTPTTWPLDEWMTVELDYRDDDSSTIAMTVSDASGSQIASVSLDETTYDSGTIGWYNYHAASDWYADSWFRVGGND